MEDQNFRLIIDHDGEIVVDDEFERKEIMLGVLEVLRGGIPGQPGAIELLFIYIS